MLVYLMRLHDIVEIATYNNSVPLV